MVKLTRNGAVVLQNWYDANSRRIAKQELVNGQSVKTLYLYDGWDIVAVMNAQGQLLESYTRGVGLAGDIGTIVAVTHHAGSGVTPGTYYTHHNHRGDVIITPSGTTTVGTCEYSAFGNLKSSIGNDVCRFKFSSKELDRATGFYYYGYRFYSPQWQRWVSRDPIGEKSQLNLYVFVNNNPLVGLDRQGLEEKPAPAPMPSPPTPIPPEKQPPVEGRKAVQEFLEKCAKGLYELHKAEIDQWLRDHPEATVCGLAAFLSAQYFAGGKVTCPLPPLEPGKCKISGSVFYDPKTGECGGKIEIKIPW